MTDSRIFFNKDQIFLMSYILTMPTWTQPQYICCRFKIQMREMTYSGSLGKQRCAIYSILHHAHREISFMIVVIWCIPHNAMEDFFSFLYDAIWCNFPRTACVSHKQFSSFFNYAICSLLKLLNFSW